MIKPRIKAVLYLLVLLSMFACIIWGLFRMFTWSERMVENAQCMPTHFKSKRALISVSGTTHYEAETLKNPPQDVVDYYSSILNPQPYTGVWTSNEIGIWEVGDIPAEVDSSGQLFQCFNILDEDPFDGSIGERGCIWIRPWENNHTLIEYSWVVSPFTRPCYSQIRSFKNTASDSN